jgi:hypothetical protein
MHNHMLIAAATRAASTITLQRLVSLAAKIPPIVLDREIASCAHAARV